MAAANSRERVLQAARRLAAEGSPVRVDEVASAAGVSRATLYRLTGGRAALLAELDLRPDPDARQRILEAALEMIGRRGLSALSMDELASRASVSRASLYRLFSGKGALFLEVVRAFSPMEAVAAVLDEHAGQPPERLMPELAAAVARTFEGRTGIIRAIFYEVTSLEPEAEEAVAFALGTAIFRLVVYVSQEMEAGRLRRMHPVLALQSFAGPLLFHLMTRELAQTRLGLDQPLEECARELAHTWLRAMRP